MIATIVVFMRGLGVAGRGHRALLLENLALRQQLLALRHAGRPRHLRRRDRLFWILPAQLWSDWRGALVIVEPATVVRWHRDWVRRRWSRLSARGRTGRPRLAPATRRVIRKMAAANPLWGAPRIHGELQKLGIEVSERTVSRLVPRWRRPPSPTWRTFLATHVATLVSIDFFTVSTITGGVLFVFLVLSHQRRRVVHVNVTAHPTAAWTAQQMIEAVPGDTAPQWALRDRDAIYGEVFQRRVAGMGITEVRSSPRSPWQNPYVERPIGSIRRECLNHVIVFNERHLRRLLTAYLGYYHGARTHLALDKDAPIPRPVQDVSDGDIVAFREVGGLHHRYERRAA